MCVQEDEFLILVMKDYKSNLSKGASSKLFEFAKEMRKSPSNAEKLLWERLRRNSLGFGFRRQHPIGNTIPDFYCHKRKLAIELDGSVHFNEEAKAKDFVRTEYLREHSVHVLRFPNWLVERNIDFVVERILKKLRELEGTEN